MRRKVHFKKGACKTGKFRYRTESDARTALGHINYKASNGNDRRVEKRCYLCPFCQGWHLTSRD